MAVTPVTYKPCDRNSFSAASIKRSRVLSNSRHSGKGTELTILTGKIKAASRCDLKHGRYDTERSSKMQAWPIRNLLRQLSAPALGMRIWAVWLIVLSNFLRYTAWPNVSWPCRWQLWLPRSIPPRADSLVMMASKTKHPAKAQPSQGVGVTRSFSRAYAELSCTLKPVLHGCGQIIDHFLKKTRQRC